MSTPADPFSPEVVTAVVAHMVEDHAADTLLIAQVHGGAPDATAARLTDLSTAGMVIEVSGAPGEEREVRVPWLEVPIDRVGIRLELVRLVEGAQEALDASPDPAA